MPLDSATILAQARQCLAIEREALDATAAILNEDFVAVVRAVETVVRDGHKLIISGVGKNAHIAQKLAGTFNSTGVPSCFLDPTQALHGDLGLCAAGDLAILLSNSGASAEMLQLLPLFEKFGLKTVALTGSPDSEMARGADLRLIYHAPREACPLALAPTASTTAALALGDALAMVLLESRGLTREDFAKYHPAGTLGMTLLLRVKDIMRAGARNSVAAQTMTVKEALLVMTRCKAGSVSVTGASGRLVGVFTDGDLRRHMAQDDLVLSRPLSKVMTRNPVRVREDALAIEALGIFNERSIDDLIVVNSRNEPVGLVDSQDLPKLKMM